MQLFAQVKDCTYRFFLLAKGKLDPELNLTDKRKGESSEEVRESYENQTIFNPIESGKKHRRIK